MQVPPFSLSVQLKELGDNLDQAVLEVLRGGQYIGGPAAIELAPVGQGVAAASPVPAKQEGVGGAGRGKRLGHLLAAVQEVREGPAAALGLGPQALGAVGGLPRGSIDDGVRAMACAKLGSL